MSDEKVSVTRHDPVTGQKLSIEFEEIDESIKVTDELKELPLHYFSSILKMAVCA